MSYSQYDEEQHILDIVRDLQRSRLLDIGAWDPVTFSNSRRLIEEGWDAVLIEPSPGPLKRLIESYSRNERVRVIGAAVTVTGNGGLVSMRVTDDAVSGNVGEEWTATGGYYGTLWTPALTMAALFAQLGGDFQLVSIDTEGTSVDLFAEMCRIGPRPRCVVVEHDGRHVELAQHAEQANYRQVHLNGTNAVLEWTGRKP